MGEPPLIDSKKQERTIMDFKRIFKSWRSYRQAGANRNRVGGREWNDIGITDADILGIAKATPRTIEG